ncbi:MAG TPA: iron-sulfur cluster repair di-iron protein [Bacteroidales bacterium]|nr:iron-sulfur cluster repair di-iron protein [Bacteroidales bacterium]
MNITANTPVGDIVKVNFKTASLFQENQIDFCCGGRKTIEQACSEAGVDQSALLGQLEAMTGMADPDTEYINSLKSDELIDYIIKRHHAYVRQYIPFLKQSLDKICDVHGENHPELFQIRDLFFGSAGDLTMHLQKEELILFPYIKKMEKAKEENLPLGKSEFGSVSNPIGMMISEHENEGQRFEKIAALSNNYNVPEDACTTYRVTINQLQDFENDLHRHIHLENNILFPKAAKMEEELVSENS